MARRAVSITRPALWNEWRRRESNPHSGDATAKCSRYTTSPVRLQFLLYTVSVRCQPFFKCCPKNKLGGFRSPTSRN